MEVIYDVSVLAQAQRYSKARTGVFRVADNVARGLATSEECHLRFCVSEKINEPLGFLARDTQLRSIPFALSRAARFKLRLYGYIHKLTDKLDAGCPTSISISVRALRKGLYLLADFVSRHGQILRPKDLSADIFHSPFHPLPEQTRGRMKRVLTVYDLIPVLYPSLFDPGIQELFPAILNSLHPGDFALCISESTKHDLCNYRSDVDPARVFVTPLAASDHFYPYKDEIELIKIRGRYGIPDGTTYFLGLSTLEPRKNIEQVIKCFARLIHEEPADDLRLVLVGIRGWDYGSILKALDRLDISRDRAIVTGYVPDEDLAPLYSGSLGFIYLSLYEGFGLPPLEAMQCGVPVITSNTSSLPEVVGDAGIMVSPSDEDAICQAMLALYRDQGLREEMSGRSIERSRLFSWDQTVAKTLAAYRLALRN